MSQCLNGVREQGYKTTVNHWECRFRK